MWHLELIFQDIQQSTGRHGHASELSYDVNITGQNYSEQKLGTAGFLSLGHLVGSQKCSRNFYKTKVIKQISNKLIEVSS